MHQIMYQLRTIHQFLFVKFLRTKVRLQPFQYFRTPILNFKMILGLIISFALATSVLANDKPQWVQPMRKVHSNTKGEQGSLLHLGDSITYSMAYFAPLQYAGKATMSPDTRKARDLVNGYMKKECYRWKGANKGNYSGQVASWGVKNADKWIDTLKPEVALIMFGSNDIRRVSIEVHEKNLRALVQKCLDRGVVVILSTIPPMHGHEDKVLQAVEAQRKIAHELKVPLIDLYAHIINRRPNDWDGTLKQFERYSKWEVPTLISNDGVHLSNPKQWRSDYTEQGLTRNGCVLRSYLTLMAYAEIIDVVVRGKAPGPVSTTILGPNPPKPAKLSGLEKPISATDKNGGPRTPVIQDWFPQAPALPKPAGGIIRANTVNALYDAAINASPGQTILIANGLYRMPRTFFLGTDNLTLRSESGDRTKVILDFSNSRHHEGIAISDCSGVTIASLTVQNVRQNGIKINSDKNVNHVTIYNVISHNVWQRHIKGPRVPDKQGKAQFSEGCRVQYCLFYNDRPKRRGDEPWEDSEAKMGFNYIGGIDIMNARRWIISDNVFTGIHGKTGEARGAVFMWHNCSQCIIERNIIIDCDTGICLGNSSGRSQRRHANDFIVRNNFIVRCSECNILVAHTRNCKIVNNTVHDPESQNGRLIRAVHANDGLVITNNIFSGPRIATQNNEGPITLKNNLIRPFGSYFIDPAKGNLHLNISAIDAINKATSDTDVSNDIDSQPRSSKPDLGADER